MCPLLGVSAQGGSTVKETHSRWCIKQSPIAKGPGLHQADLHSKRIFLPKVLTLEIFFLSSFGVAQIQGKNFPSPTPFKRLWARGVGTVISFTILIGFFAANELFNGGLACSVSCGSIVLSSFRFKTANRKSSEFSWITVRLEISRTKIFADKPWLNFSRFNFRGSPRRTCSAYF